mmetsp:Transcript_1194/g.4203  ORF Transcript_1194/g.4203 Transcript_1194/m.4203 type:complete len:307 (-) Transcript_1194:558-1478(-)
MVLQAVRVVGWDVELVPRTETEARRRRIVKRRRRATVVRQAVRQLERPPRRRRDEEDLRAPPRRLVVLDRARRQNDVARDPGRRCRAAHVDLLDVERLRSEPDVARGSALGPMPRDGQLRRDQRLGAHDRRPRGDRLTRFVPELRRVAALEVGRHGRLGRARGRAPAAAAGVARPLRAVLGLWRGGAELDGDNVLGRRLHVVLVDDALVFPKLHGRELSPPRPAQAVLVVVQLLAVLKRRGAVHRLAHGDARRRLRGAHRRPSRPRRPRWRRRLVLVLFSRLGPRHRGVVFSRLGARHRGVVLGRL